MSIIQVGLTVFLLFAISRVFARFRSSEVSVPGLILWSAIFGSAILAVLFPSVTTQVAKQIGIGRGVDAVVYASIVLLFYLVFRLYVFIQDIRRDISELVTKIALRDHERSNEKPSRR